MDGFQHLFSRFILEKGPQMVWDNILPISEGTIRSYSDIPEPSADQIHEQLNKLVVVKLNGGLGTSMGCQGPKSLIAVRNELTFLDLTIQQIEVSERGVGESRGSQSLEFCGLTYQVRSSVIWTYLFESVCEMRDIKVALWMACCSFSDGFSGGFSVCCG